ncbi:MAG TPA: fibronectin type III domain-containing protein [Candidatus Magasanikbacteria bacterium]|nr:fibronectin type III domain-containing protein [Candidatus Magasanikbacteria bacterium]
MVNKRSKILQNFFLLTCFILGCLFVSTKLVAASTTTSTGSTTVSGTYTEPDDDGPGPGQTEDTTAPASISNLAIVSVTANNVGLSWIAPGDDGIYGTAASYDLRYSSNSLDSNNWNTATAANGEPTPLTAGNNQSFVVNNLSAATTYYFALKTIDDAGNISSLSNIATTSTLAAVIVDTVAPEISNISITKLSNTSVRVTWNTNENATSTVNFGVSTNYELGSVTSPTLTTSHSLDLVGLNTETTYHFRVRSADASFNEAVSADQTFNLGDLSVPIISNIQVTNLTGTSARITWLTNEVATSSVDYGPTINYEIGTASDNNLVTAHVVNLIGLQPQTTYHFRVRSADASFNEAMSADQTFSTADTIPPIITNIKVVPQVISATITWQTNEAADSQVAYGRNSDLGSLTSSSYKVTDHSITIGGLQGATRYYFLVRSTDSSGNQASSEMLNFTTASDQTPPANVSNLSLSAGDKKNTLTWQNPSDNDLSGVIIKRSLSSYPANSTEGATVYQGSGTNFTDENLINGTTYYYSVFAFDTSNNFSSGAIISGTPVAAGQPPEEIIVPPETGGPGEVVVPLSAFSFSTAKGKITLPAVSEINLLPSFDLGIEILSSKFPKPVESLVLNFNNNFYLFSFEVEKNIWSTEILVPEATGNYSASIRINFQDKQTAIVEWQTQVLPWGQIYEKKNGLQVPVVGATVSLLTSPTLWPAEAYGEKNPQITNDRGEFGFVVPEGRYVLQIEKTGFQTRQTGYFNSQGVVINNNLEILAVPPKLEEIIDPEAPLATNVVNVAKNLSAKTVFVSKIVTTNVSDFVADPVVKQITKDVVAPVVTGVAAVGTTAAVGASELLIYLRFLFTQPILVLFRRKRRGWGVVYNSLTKIPLDLVTVRLIEAATGRVVQSKVTDKEGRYAFLPLPGEYLIDIKQNNFKFPTEFLRVLTEDKNFLDLYHGEKIVVKEKGAVITPNIPLDPLGQERPIGKILWHLALRRLQKALSVISLILAAVFVIISPSILTGVLFGVQVVFYILFLRLAYPKKPKSWGIVYNIQGKKPLEKAVVRIFDTQYNKLLETQITDTKGRYSFLVGRNKYYMMYEKNGFETKQSEPVDLQNHSEPTASIGVDVDLCPQSSESSSIGKV